MTLKRLTRTLAAGGLGLSLVVGLLAVPTIALAATPSWASGPTVNLPEIVKEGSAAGFATTITNNGPSNISQLSVTAFSAQPFIERAEGEVVNPEDVEGSAVPVYAAVYRNGSELQGACPSPLATPLICTVAGGLSAGGVATLIVAFPTSGTDDIGVHGWWQSNGTGSSFCTDGDNSQGDCLPFHSDATMVSNDGNRGGGFSVADGGTAATDAFGASVDNLASTSLKAPAGVKNVILTVADDGAVIDDPDCADCVNLPTSELHLGDGSPLPAGSFMTVVIEFHKTALKGINFGKLTVRHFHDDESFHDIPTQKSCDGTAECAMFENLAGGHGRVTIYLNQNGFIKYH